MKRRREKGEGRGERKEGRGKRGEGRGGRGGGGGEGEERGGGREGEERGGGGEERGGGRGKEGEEVRHGWQYILYEGGLCTLRTSRGLVAAVPNTPAHKLALQCG